MSETEQSPNEDETDEKGILKTAEYLQSLRKCGHTHPYHCVCTPYGRWPFSYTVRSLKIDATDPATPTELGEPSLLRLELGWQAACPRVPPPVSLLGSGAGSLAAQSKSQNRWFSEPRWSCGFHRNHFQTSRVKRRTARARMVPIRNDTGAYGQYFSKIVGTLRFSKYPFHMQSMQNCIYFSVQIKSAYI